MRFKATENINLRLGPSIESPKVGSIPKGTFVESDEYIWKAVTLSSGAKGFCAATYLEAAPSAWHPPIRKDKFVITQKFLTPDAQNYPITGVHPGTDYGTGGVSDVPLYFCADGEVIETGANHAYFGNYFFYYVPEVDRTFAYFHLKSTLPTKGQHKAGKQCGVAGKTGLSYGIHLHLECIRGRKTSAERKKLYTSKAALMSAAEDADTFIRARL